MIDIKEYSIYLSNQLIVATHERVGLINAIWDNGDERGTGTHSKYTSGWWSHY